MSSASGLASSVWTSPGSTDTRKLIADILKVVSLAEQVSGVTVQAQIDRAPGTVPFHLIVDASGEPGGGYHKWLDIKAAPMIEGRRA